METARKAIRIGIVGIGNCSASLVQAMSRCQRLGALPGLTHDSIGGFRVSDLQVVAAFDVDERKIGKDVSDALFIEPNCTSRYEAIPRIGVDVQPGMVLDGVAEHMRDIVLVASETASIQVDDIASQLARSQTDVLVIYLPVGSQLAAEAYADAALRAECSVVNCTPAVLATSPTWAQRARECHQVILGDDMKSQIGSTTVHRTLLSMLAANGVTVESTYQLNIGGNTDFRNMKDPSRGNHKVRTKLAGLERLLPAASSITAGPSEYVPHMRDFKCGMINVQGTGLLGMPVSIDLTLRVEDSPNAAGVGLNAIRCAYVGRLRQEYGVIDSVCAQLFKNPSVGMDEVAARSSFDAFAADTDSYDHETMPLISSSG